MKNAPAWVRRWTSRRTCDAKALAEEIGRRVGKLRNDLAHDKLNWDFEAVQISDIQVVEELIYSIRLKNIGLEPDKARRAIQKLFQEKNIQIKL